MTYEEVFSKSKEIIMNSDVSGIDSNLAIEIDIVGEGSGAFYIELKNGVLSVEPYEYYDRDCKFIVTAENFLKLADGSLDSVSAFMTGKLKVEGNMEKALEFKKIADSVKNNKNKKKRRKA
ncbi:SCP2 sterol-binding domain-containing protein [Porcipelethomonas sp.]|uniref:SCP2 sterol-binding domain-containing protein n=1 Tax=Porcipelethomonas sp. TaxID=2981675 RepID=UPI003EF77D5C